MDLLSVKKPSDIKSIGKTNWVMIVDEFTGLKFSNFYQAKDRMVEPTCVKLKTFKNMNKAVKFMRCDNAGENKNLDKRANSSNWKLNITFECTARATPNMIV